MGYSVEAYVEVIHLYVQSHIVCWTHAPFHDRMDIMSMSRYAPQRAFILSGTVRENILFGRPLDAARVDAVLQASAFIKDLQLLPAGMDTEIGERGTTLSGGQQQRLSVARALYGNPKLLVLDDPLSAVDSQVCTALTIKSWIVCKDAFNNAR